MCKNPTLFWSQSVTPLRPPTASQWAAVRITTEACRRSNPHGVIPGVEDPRRVHWQFKKPIQGFKTEARELLGGTEENSVSLTMCH